MTPADDVPPADGPAGGPPVGAPPGGGGAPDVDEQPAPVEEPVPAGDDVVATDDMPGKPGKPGEPTPDKQPDKQPDIVIESHDLTDDEIADIVGGGGDNVPADFPQTAVADTPVAVAEAVQPAKVDPVMGGGEELPFTGAESIVLLACAFMLLASGVIFRLSARRQAATAGADSNGPGVDVQFAWRNGPPGMA